MIETVLLIVVLSLVSNYSVYRMLAADPNVVSRRDLSRWYIPEAAPLRLETLDNGGI